MTKYIWRLDKIAVQILVINDTLYIFDCTPSGSNAMHNKSRMPMPTASMLDGRLPCWICVKIGYLLWRDLSLWGFSTVDTNGTNELISGEKPLTAILSNLRLVEMLCTNLECPCWVATRHVGFVEKSGICHGGIYGDFQLRTRMVQTNSFKVRNL